MKITPLVTAPAPALNLPPQAIIDRDSLRQQIAAHEKNMRAEPGSAAWKAYWKEGGSTAYHDALERLQQSTDAMAGLAGGTPALAQPSPAAPLPTPTAPAQPGA